MNVSCQPVTYYKHVKNMYVFIFDRVIWFDKTYFPSIFSKFITLEDDRNESAGYDQPLAIAAISIT